MPCLSFGFPCLALALLTRSSTVHQFSMVNHSIEDPVCLSYVPGFSMTIVEAVPPAPISAHRSSRSHHGAHQSRPCVCGVRSAGYRLNEAPRCVRSGTSTAKETCGCLWMDVRSLACSWENLSMSAHWSRLRKTSIHVRDSVMGDEMEGVSGMLRE